MFYLLTNKLLLKCNLMLKMSIMPKVSSIHSNFCTLRQLVLQDVFVSLLLEKSELSLFYEQNKLLQACFMS